MAHINILSSPEFFKETTSFLADYSYRSAPADDWGRDAVRPALQVDGAALPRLQRPPVQPHAAHRVSQQPHP